MAIRYSKDHVWIREEGGAYRVGLSDYARRELGEIVYVELPKPGARFAKSDPVCSIDSLKSTSDIYAPVSGSVIAANPALADAKAINADPLGAGWIFSMTVDHPEELEELLSEEEYRSFVQ